MEEIRTLVQKTDGNTPGLESVVRYLKLTTEQYLEKLNATNKLEFFSNNLSYKRWTQVALAQGWLITSYVPVLVYLTYDNLLVVFDHDGGFVKKV